MRDWAAILQPAVDNLTAMDTDVQAALESAGGGGTTGGSAGLTVLSYKTRDLGSVGGSMAVPAGSPAAGTTTLWITADPVTVDGNTEICVEAYISALEPEWGQAIVVNLYEGSMNLGGIINSPTPNFNATRWVRGGGTGLARVYLTPEPGTHTYSLRMYATGGTTSYAYSGAAPAAITGWALAYMRITKGS